MSIQKSLAALFHHSKNEGLSGIYQFNCTDRHMWIDTNLDSCVNWGLHPKPDVTITISENDLLNTLSGSADIEELYATGGLTINGDIGLATILPQLIQRKLTALHNIETTTTNKRHSARKRFSEIISANAKPIFEIERRTHDDLSIEYFRSHYVNSGIPLIICNSITDWPLFNISKQDTLKYFEGLQGIARKGDYADQAFSNKRKFQTVSMVDFVQSIDTPESTHTRSDLPAYLGNNILPEKLLELIKHPLYFEKNQYVAPRIWIGPKNTLTPLHRDDVDNLFVQVRGSKRFILAAPHNRAALGAWSTTAAGGLDGCDFDPENPDYNSFPNSQQVHFLIFELEAGQILYLPEGWFHQVRSLSPSISVNFWTKSFRH
ncbi:cupin-like domain-containing protein [Pseudomonas fluorescens]|uniref:JmjC domain-containing protein n=1 Tax=Pseudomonas fluorescens TaxID=294 RepID=A0A5E6ZV28_PSEFL|nr:cupin-like domain-containing protein [Pseudomonas fluorescens]VVN70308.1 hypothetical protein PS704_00379 [Pseudomonas fluorescens]